MLTLDYISNEFNRQPVEISDREVWVEQIILHLISGNENLSLDLIIESTDANNGVPIDVVKEPLAV